jgi:hypothetical protein
MPATRITPPCTEKNPSALPLQQDGPIVGVGRGRRLPDGTVYWWKLGLVAQTEVEL